MDQPTARTTNKMILCIEDELFISELYERALTKAGYTVTVVNDGQKALEEALTNAYDVIMLDIMLPNILGTDILKKLRGPDVATPIKSKIIITTNLEQKKEDREQIEKLADAYVIKAAMTPKEMVVFIDQLTTSTT